ncbi:MAG: erythromycin esterase family protein, partial [Bacteroidota bacterium]
VRLELAIPAESQQIFFGFIFSGKGQAWFDDFEIWIDGKQYEETPVSNYELSPTARQWLLDHLIPLDTCAPEEREGDDLRTLGQRIGDARVIALGEVTHGSRAIFQMKDRIIRYLIESKFLRRFAIEGNWPEAETVNDHLRFNPEYDGTAGDQLKNMYFWTWQTEEVAAMVDWMRSYNQGAADPLFFSGFDLQYTTGVLNALRQALPAKQHPLLTTVAEEIAYLREQRSQSSTVTLSPAQQRFFTQSLEALRYGGWENRSPRAMARNHHYLRILEQWLEFAPISRDRFMAENMQWLLDQEPEQRYIIWAHNEHLRQNDNRMGQFLHESLGEDYLSIGFALYEGEHTAKSSGGLNTFPLNKAPAGSYEAIFNQLDTPIFALDLREITTDTPLADWLDQGLGWRSTGAGPDGYNGRKTNITEQFDLVIFIRETEASRLLDF